MQEKRNIQRKKKKIKKVKKEGKSKNETFVKR